MRYLEEVKWPEALFPWRVFLNVSVTFPGYFDGSLVEKFQYCGNTIFVLITGDDGRRSGDRQITPRSMLSS